MITQHEIEDGHAMSDNEADLEGPGVKGRYGCFY